VIGVSRSPPAFSGRMQHVPADLLDAGDCRRRLAPFHAATHIFYCARQARRGWQRKGGGERRHAAQRAKRCWRGCRASSRASAVRASTWPSATPARSSRRLRCWSIGCKARGRDQPACFCGAVTCVCLSWWLARRPRCANSQVRPERGKRAHSLRRRARASPDHFRAACAGRSRARLRTSSPPRAGSSHTPPTKPEAVELRRYWRAGGGSGKRSRASSPRVLNSSAASPPS